ncbi:O-antigen ligase family protein [Nocardioides sp. LHG3406-4]|uniref:O-antigen ligase family protein n=1 Tax=Nocardioides sp. LHG3406-4 TaxID=2804575 RepID=UPI003CE799B8
MNTSVAAAPAPAPARGMVDRLAEARLRVKTYHASREPARENSVRGVLWILFIATEFYLFSNPLVYIYPFEASLQKATSLAVIMLVVQLPKLRLPPVPWTLLVFIAYAADSAFWSIQPDYTWKTLWLYGSIAIIALMVAANTTPKVLAQGCTLGGIVILLSSWYAVETGLVGAMAPAGLDGYLAGVGGNRNILSYCMVIAIGFAAAYFPTRWWARVVWFLSVATLLVGVFLAQSVSGFLASGFILAGATMLGFMERRSRRTRRRTTVVISGVLAVLTLLFLAVPSLLGGFLGRDSTTLSGRVPLWEATIQQSEPELWFGYGFGAVWQHPWLPAPDNTLAQKIYAGAGILLSHGHNSFIDVLPQLGILGVLFLVAMHLAALWPAIGIRMNEVNTREGLVASRVILLSMTGLLIFGLTEPLTSTPLGWFVLVALLEVGRPYLRSQGRHAHPRSRFW